MGWTYLVLIRQPADWSYLRQPAIPLAVKAKTSETILVVTAV
jgi:hypothetical protein